MVVVAVAEDSLRESFSSFEASADGDAADAEDDDGLDEFTTPPPLLLAGAEDSWNKKRE